MIVTVLPVNYAPMDNGYIYVGVDRVSLRYKGELHVDVHTQLPKEAEKRTLIVEWTNTIAVLIDSGEGDDVKTNS